MQRQPIVRWLLSVAAMAVAFGLPARAADRPNLTGKKAPTFEATTTDKQKVTFPGSYKGKVVLLDFWAMWCGPCRAELPTLSATYQKYHSKGFEVLGISLDQPNSEAKLAQFTKANNMPWPQVYDGKFWKAAVAQAYDVHAIPRPILVDGDTGVVLGDGPAIRGEHLAPAIEKALAARQSATQHAQAPATPLSPASH